MVVQHLLRQWLRQQATEKLQEKVAEAARQQADGESEPLPPVDVGLVFGLGIEAGGIADLLSDTSFIRGADFKIQLGNLGSRRLAVVTSGIGWEAAAKATTTLILGHQPQWIFSSGFAGGLQPDLKQRDIVMADAVLDTDGARLDLDMRVDSASVGQREGVQVGALLTADHAIRQPQEKQALGEKYRALAVDTETFAVAEVCRHHQVAFLAVRTIIDTMRDALPADLERLTDEKNTMRKLGAAVGTVWRRPGAVKDFYKLKEDALATTDHLGKFLRSMIDQLPCRDAARPE